jgi:Cyclin M transmembrane N-terminal domain
MIHPPFTNVTLWIGIAFCIAQTGIFSGLNLALFSVSRLRLEIEAAGGNGDAAKMLSLRADSNFTLATILWGNVATNVTLSAGRAPAPQYPPLGRASPAGLASNLPPEPTPTHSNGIAWLSRFDYANERCKASNQPNQLSALSPSTRRFTTRQTCNGI